VIPREEEDVKSVRELLERAKSAWKSSLLAHRDSIIETGDLLHQYILAGIAEGRHRAELILDAAKELGLTDSEVCNLVLLAAAVRLLSDNGNVGTQPQRAIRPFKRLVRRKSNSRETVGQKPHADDETWLIRFQYAESAPKLFRLAVAEEMPWHRVEQEVLKLMGLKKRGASNVPMADQPAACTLLASAKHASPGDIAEMVLELIRSAEDPQAVAERLLPEIQRIKQEKRRPSIDDILSSR
jgi:hypothetical protein